MTAAERARALVRQWFPTDPPVGMADAITAALEAKGKDVWREAAEEVDKCVMKGPAPIGPLYGVGWNAAVHFISDALALRAPGDADAG